jgi:hypothetical protein
MMAREADEIHIIGLTNALKHGCKIAYLNAAAGHHANFHEFMPNEDGPKKSDSSDILLLYRPGAFWPTDC